MSRLNKTGGAIVDRAMEHVASVDLGSPATAPGGGAAESRIEAIYVARYGAFVRLAIQITRDPQTGQDVVQEAFAKALRRRRGFRAESDLEGWLWRIVLNTARDARRARHEIPRAALEPPTIDPPVADEGARLRALIARLPERQRTMLFLRYYADMDYRAIARVLRVRVGTVSSTLSQAQSNLRDLIEEARP